jgi:hypothetical protein
VFGNKKALRFVNLATEHGREMSTVLGRLRVIWNRAAGSYKSGRAGFTKGMNSKNFDPPSGLDAGIPKVAGRLIGRVFDVS